MYGYIYLITDTVKGNRYVGQHKYDKYFELDRKYRGSGSIIIKINRKNKERLKIEYLMPVETEEEANFFEKYWIYKLNTLFPNGYNISKGGGEYVPWNKGTKGVCKPNSGSFKKGVKHSEEWKEFMSFTMKEKWLEEEFRKKHENLNVWNKGTKGVCKPNSGSFKKGHIPNNKGKEGLKGEKHPMFGKHHTEEAKEKNRIAHLGVKQTKEAIEKRRLKNTNGKLSKTVLQYTIDGEFVKEWPSTKEVYRQTGFSFKHISACCLGKKKTAYKYIWKYKHNEDITETDADQMG